jgi:hypothetical protein
LFLCSCNKHNSKQPATGIDTAQIITQVFNSKKILESIPAGIDTIYLIKSSKFKHYNNSWPKTVKKLKLIYLDDTPENTIKLSHAAKVTDRPLRYIVTDFSIKPDSANIWIYGINQWIDYHYNLVRKDGNWKIIRSGRLME